MRRRWWLYGLKFVLFVVVAVAAVGGAVMLLWNWLLPDLFGWQLISFWQAVGLLVLARILLGGFRGRWGHGGHWRARMAARWEQMSEEERAQFRTGMRHRCGRGHGRSEPAEQQV
jgi:membrane protease YdiL (CAAX protease family)